MTGQELLEALQELDTESLTKPVYIQGHNRLFGEALQIRNDDSILFVDRIKEHTNV